jgi:hypothetical protein
MAYEVSVKPSITADTWLVMPLEGGQTRTLPGTPFRRIEKSN